MTGAFNADGVIVRFSNRVKGLSLGGVDCEIRRRTGATRFSSGRVELGDEYMYASSTEDNDNDISCVYLRFIGVTARNEK